MIFMIYLISIVDSVKAVSNAIAIIAFIGFFVTVICYFSRLDDDCTSTMILKLKKLTIAFLIVSVFSAFTSVFVPKSEGLAAMYIVPKIVENRDMQEIPPKLSKLLNVKLDKWIDAVAESTNERNHY